MANMFFAGIPIEGSGARPLEADLYGAENQATGDVENISATGNLNIGTVIQYDEHAQRHMTGGVMANENGLSSYISDPARNPSGFLPLAADTHQVPMAGGSGFTQPTSFSGSAFPNSGFSAPSALPQDFALPPGTNNPPLAAAASPLTPGGQSLTQSTAYSNTSSTSTSSQGGETNNSYNTYNETITNTTNNETINTQNNTYNNGGNSVITIGPHNTSIIDIGNITIGGNGGGGTGPGNDHPIFNTINTVITNETNLLNNLTTQTINNIFNNGGGGTGGGSGHDGLLQDIHNIVTTVDNATTQIVATADNAATQIISTVDNTLNTITHGDLTGNLTGTLSSVVSNVANVANTLNLTNVIDTTVNATASVTAGLDHALQIDVGNILNGNTINILSGDI
jgi:hypothetical protein